MASRGYGDNYGGDSLLISVMRRLCSAECLQKYDMGFSATSSIDIPLTNSDTDRLNLTR